MRFFPIRTRWVLRDCVSGCDNGIAERSRPFARRQPPIRRYLTRHSYSYNPGSVFLWLKHDLTGPCILARQLSRAPFTPIIQRIAKICNSAA